MMEGFNGSMCSGDLSEQRPSGAAVWMCPCGSLYMWSSTFTKFNDISNNKAVRATFGASEKRVGQSTFKEEKRHLKKKYNFIL